MNTETQFDRIEPFPHPLLYQSLFHNQSNLKASTTAITQSQIVSKCKRQKLLNKSQMIQLIKMKIIETY